MGPGYTYGYDVCNAVLVTVDMFAVEVRDRASNMLSGCSSMDGIKGEKSRHHGRDAGARN